MTEESDDNDGVNSEFSTNSGIFEQEIGLYEKARERICMRINK